MVRGQGKAGLKGKLAAKGSFDVTPWMGWDGMGLKYSTSPISIIDDRVPYFPLL